MCLLLLLLVGSVSDDYGAQGGAGREQHPKHGPEGGGLGLEAAHLHGPARHRCLHDRAAPLVHQAKEVAHLLAILRSGERQEDKVLHQSRPSGPPQVAYGECFDGTDTRSSSIGQPACVLSSKQSHTGGREEQVRVPAPCFSPPRRKGSWEQCSSERIGALTTKTKTCRNLGRYVVHSCQLHVSQRVHLPWCWSWWVSFCHQGPQGLYQMQTGVQMHQAPCRSVLLRCGAGRWSRAVSLRSTSDRPSTLCATLLACLAAINPTGTCELDPATRPLNCLVYAASSPLLCRKHLQ